MGHFPERKTFTTNLSPIQYLATGPPNPIAMKCYMLKHVNRLDTIKAGQPPSGLNLKKTLFLPCV